MTPGQVLLFAVGGLANAAYLFIVAAGLSLVFGALRVINMAHGSLYMIAAFVTVVIGNQLGAGLGFWGGMLVAVAVAGAIGGVVEVLVLRRVYGREHLVQLLGTYAVSLIIAGAVRIVFGGLGSIVGSAVGALIVGMVISFGLVIPATNPFALAFVFIIMTAVLIVRPRGLFGLPES